MPHLAGITLKALVKLGKRAEDCWQWLGPIDALGYGRKTFHGRDLLAHRWIWMQLFGPLDHALVIAQTCGNNGCVNPHHLVAATHGTNMRASTVAKLTPDEVREIRRAKKDKGLNTARLLAERFDVSPSTIRDIWRGDTWGRRTCQKVQCGPRASCSSQ